MAENRKLLDEHDLDNIDKSSECENPPLREDILRMASDIRRYREAIGLQEHGERQRKYAVNEICRWRTGVCLTSTCTPDNCIFLEVTGGKS